MHAQKKQPPRRLIDLALSPWLILLSMGGGLAFGTYMPEMSLNLGFVGEVYLDLMKMVVLPFMLSAVILSTQRLIQEGRSGRLFGRLVIVFAGFSVVSVLVAIGIMLVMQPGADLTPQTMSSFGEIVGGDLDSNNLSMTLNGEDQQSESSAMGFEQLLLSLVPSNIFSALVNDDTLKILVFSLLIGLAVGHVTKDASDTFGKTLEALYEGCQMLMRWMTYLLPLVLFCMTAGQLAETGVGPLLAMMQFVAAFSAASLIVLILTFWIIWFRANVTLGQAAMAMKGPFALAVATRNSVICMPIMIESLIERLGFARSQVELLVPLSVSLLRIGPMVYYACATLFIAQLYGIQLSITELALVVTASVMAGFASAGMTGLAVVSLIGVSCGYLGLPFEAAFMLFLAVDPICDLLRTLVLVLANMASVTLMTTRPEPMPEDACPV
ncbi:dicarboxylate/amino acid:cation symporter [Imhoffiella purpurea]|uniref:Sodium:dicarboxylate symporter n=1 Tax=Imhoffiella purpurea TaxID=1249627 RepID=W9V5P1_9GAMM|nr:cation:dicarboxylase symporter family transporter [Imhoffiella purpurea]EXJ14833.1 Sodium:dicarboxylate symporter [Imhoffiella purpurea]